MFALLNTGGFTIAAISTPGMERLVMLVDPDTEFTICVGASPGSIRAWGGFLTERWTLYSNLPKKSDAFLRSRVFDIHRWFKSRETARKHQTLIFRIPEDSWFNNILSYVLYPLTDHPFVTQILQILWPSHTSPWIFYDDRWPISITFLQETHTGNTPWMGFQMPP